MFCLQQHAECLVHHVQDGWTVTDGTTLKKKHDLLGAKAEMKNKDVEKKPVNHLRVIIKSKIIQLQIAHELNYPLTQTSVLQSACQSGDVCSKEGQVIL